MAKLRAWADRWPFAEMTIGDSFRVTNPQLFGRARSALASYEITHRNFKGKALIVDEHEDPDDESSEIITVLRIWRVAKDEQHSQKAG